MLAGLSEATKMLDFVARYPGRGERFVQPLAGDGRSCDLASVSPNRGGCNYGQRGLGSGGGAYLALWLSTG